MKKLLLLLLCVPLIFSCGEKDEEKEEKEIQNENPLDKKITEEMRQDGYIGEGTYTYDGNKYIGEWKDGKFHGKGTYTDADAKKYVGEWKDGKQHGDGTSYSAYGKKYVGEFKNGEKHGEGTFFFDSGGKYVGLWKNGMMHGKGINIELVEDCYHIKLGEWRNGMMHDGEYSITYPDGQVVKMGLIENGEFIGK
jgi:hypothetical protein